MAVNLLPPFYILLPVIKEAVMKEKIIRLDKGKARSAAG